MLTEKMSELVSGMDAILIISPDDAIGNCWSGQGTHYYVFKALSEAADKENVKLFMDRGRGLIIHDGDYFRMLDLTENWTGITQFDYEEIADKVDEAVGKPRSEMVIGFGGSYSVSCVRRHLHAMCDEIVESTDPAKLIVNMGNDSLKEKYEKGFLLYELTEDPEFSIFTDDAIKREVIKSNKKLNEMAYYNYT